MKRFYGEAGIARAGAGFAVTLDGRALRTPAGAPFELPTEALARAVAGEWRAQGDEVRPETMGMTSLAATAIDRVAPRAGAVARELVDRGAGDLLCHRERADRPLGRRQAEAWQPLLDWLERRHGARLRVVEGVMPTDQDPAALAALGRALPADDSFRLAALHRAASAAGSLVVALALLDGELDAAEAWARARVDEDWQAENWGDPGDPDALAAAARMRQDLEDAGRFVELLARREGRE